MRIEWYCSSLKFIVRSEIKMKRELLRTLDLWILFFQWFFSAKKYSRTKKSKWWKEKNRESFNSDASMVLKKKQQKQNTSWIGPILKQYISVQLFGSHYLFFFLRFSCSQDFQMKWVNFDGTEMCIIATVALCISGMNQNNGAEQFLHSNLFHQINIYIFFKCATHQQQVI